MNISSTAPTSSCLRALSVVLYCLDMSVSSTNLARMVVVVGTVDQSGMIGVGPGFTGGRKGTAERLT
jgi:hypothetical protein